jgi:hypothetical protein
VSAAHALKEEFAAGRPTRRDDARGISCPAALPGKATTRHRRHLYLAACRRDDGTVVTFDPTGRVTAIACDRPNLGRTETAYDFNRLKGITAPVNMGNAAQGGANVAGSSDPQGRGKVEQRRERLPGGAGATNVTYAYGAPTLAGDANGNRAGRITRITSQMGVEERQYGKLGETVFEKKTVTTFTDPLHPSVFETRFFFDTFGRMLKITYPDGEVVTNVYDSGGNLQSTAGVKAQAASGANHRYTYLRSLLYDQFEQRVLVEQGNGVKTTYTYDAQTRRSIPESALHLRQSRQCHRTRQPGRRAPAQSIRRAHDPALHLRRPVSVDPRRGQLPVLALEDAHVHDGHGLRLDPQHSEEDPAPSDRSALGRRYHPEEDDLRLRLSIRGVWAKLHPPPRPDPHRGSGLYV